MSYNRFNGIKYLTSIKFSLSLWLCVYSRLRPSNSSCRGDLPFPQIWGDFQWVGATPFFNLFQCAIVGYHTRVTIPVAAAALEPAADAETAMKVMVLLFCRVVNFTRSLRRRRLLNSDEVAKIFVHVA